MSGIKNTPYYSWEEDHIRTKNQTAARTFFVLGGPVELAGDEDEGGSRGGEGMC
jgi:hypothetical protein